MFNEFAEHHKEFRMPDEPGRTISKRAAEELKGIFYDESGELLPENTVINNVKIFAARLAAVVPQLKDNPDWKAKGPATDDEYASSQRTLHKSMQSLFSTPIVKMQYWRDDSSVKKDDLSNIVIDPTKITPQMLRNLGLDDCVPPKGMRMELRTAHMAQAIPEIKQIIGHLKPFSLPGEKSRTQKRGFRLFTTPDGYVVGIQSVGGRKVLYRTDIHGACRRIDHIRDNYREEIGILRSIQSEIRDISNEIRLDWAKARETLPQKQAKLQACVDQLRFVKNAHKIELRKRIKRCVSFQVEHKTRDGETQVRFNPGSRLAILATTSTFVGWRIGEIESISGYLGQDKIRIESNIAEQQTPVEDFFQKVEKGHSRFALLDGNKPLSQKKAAEISGNLRQLRDACEAGNSAAGSGISLQPYLSYAHAVCEHMDTAIAWMTLGNREKAGEEFLKAYVISKLQHCFMDLQATYEARLAPEKVPYFRDLVAYLRRIRKELLEKRVAPHVPVPDFNSSFVTPVIKLLNDLIDIAAPAALREATTEDREAAKKKMRKLFHEFDFILSV